MMFLLRMAFWLTIVFALLPGHGKSSSDISATLAAATHAAATHAGAGIAASSNSAGAGSTGTQVDPVAALGAASAAVSDASGFCGRQPQACTIGAQVIQAVGERAEAGARLLLSYVGTQIAQEKRKVAERAQGRPSTDTLTTDDLAPVWQGQPPATVPAVPLPPKRPASV
jgi:hypothetical protein